jgi:hypothetical protein
MSRESELVRRNSCRGAAGWSCLLYFLARRLARPFAVRPLPRARAAFPLAPAERLPVNFEKASSIRPADLSMKPSVLSRRPDFIATPFRLGLEAQPRCFPGTTARIRIRGLPGAGEGHRVGQAVLVSGEVEAVHLGTPLADALDDLRPVARERPGDVPLPQAVQIADAPLQLV